jgi:hypothetical protein
MRILNSGGRAIPGAATGLGDARSGGNVGGAAAAAAGCVANAAAGR